MNDSLAAKTVEFCSRLRGEHAFAIGPREATEALRAIEIAGVANRRRVAAALRAVCCSRPEELEIFARAFDAFFAAELPGAPQPQHARRKRRPERGTAPQDAPQTAAERPPHSTAREAPSARDALAKTLEPVAESVAQAWQVLLARYSPADAAASPPAIPADGLDAARREADRLVTRLHLGRSLRWKPRPRGERFDLRRTLRAGLRTGGELIEPHMLGHPLRNPRFVVLIDGSRSMSEDAPRMLQFAYALCKRSRHASVFLFSTRICDVTLRLRAVDPQRSASLPDLGEAWGGGTRIGASLSEFVRKHGAKLTDQTFVMILSDGLDVGEIAQLRVAMHEIARRCAAIAWVNPHARRAGYEPTAGGMRAALPYVTTFGPLERMDELIKIGRPRANVHA